MLNKLYNILVIFWAPIAISILILSVIVFHNSYDKPLTAKEFASTSVKILSLSNNAGGSGVILDSDIFSSRILTNKHICRLIENGGYVLRDGQYYLIQSYKKDTKHDLCLLQVQYGFGINTKVASERPENFSGAYISGHPGLMPHVLTQGNFSGRENLNIITAFRKCTKEEKQGRYAIYCWLFGGMPIIETFESQLVTGTILPGSSGSGVFNQDGEIGGLVFAARGKGLSYAFIVPYEYLVDFLEREEMIDWTKAGEVYDYRNFFQRIFKFEDACQNPKSPLINLCKFTGKYLIWRR